MITAYLVGDQQLLKWLDTLPGVINTGLVRSITRLGIGLQRTLQRLSRWDRLIRPQGIKLIGIRKLAAVLLLEFFLRAKGLQRRERTL